MTCAPAWSPQCPSLPPRTSNRAQQRAFDRFRKEYNHDRPHQALGGNVPADHYERSSRRPPAPIWGKPFMYPSHFETAKISKLGYLQWNGRAAFLSSALAHETLGLDWKDRHGWEVYFGTMHLGSLRRGIKGGPRFTPTTPVTQVSATNRHQRP